MIPVAGSLFFGVRHCKLISILELGNTIITMLGGVT